MKRKHWSSSLLIPIFQRQSLCATGSIEAVAISYYKSEWMGIHWKRPGWTCTICENIQIWMKEAKKPQNDCRGNNDEYPFHEF
ncbi:hypothetical protein BDW42DRAFT_159969 [Aspergillus taichungensis]|uniref:Uncharacterized protein n=1 Tax=Aspergillus taichungensis TaxID=482145 RepID=A0A2J5I722_9EURO|nr:hypothetical protein BDW42DRAFT_159969 [Aspergillus taichungensis]